MIIFFYFCCLGLPRSDRSSVSDLLRLVRVPGRIRSSPVGRSASYKSNALPTVPWRHLRGCSDQSCVNCVQTICAGMMQIRGVITDNLSVGMSSRWAFWSSRRCAAPRSAFATAWLDLALAILRYSRFLGFAKPRNTDRF